MGLRGPAPKREEERRRRNKPEVEVVKVNLDETLAGEVEIPVADPDWDPIVLHFWDSFSRSGQSIWYEPTDWAAAYTLMEALDRHLKPQLVRNGEKETAELVEFDDDGKPVVLTGKEYLWEERIIPPPAGFMNAFLKGLASLMALEGDRRRLAVELERKAAIEAALSGADNVTVITKNRADLFKSKAPEDQTS